jgi:NAD(P)-dependent dehydrogenase (short-subunit alcohol dehydrogenase family)
MTSSIAHKWSKFDSSNPQKHSRVLAYYDSKFALLLFTYELARRLQGTNVTATAFDPGFVWTSMNYNNGLLGRSAMLLANIFNHAVSPEVGAQTPVYLATAPEVAGITGKYYFRKEMVPSSKETYNEAWAKQLWELSQELTTTAAAMR